MNHFSTLLSAPWSAWTMLGLLVVGALAEVCQPGVITQAPSSVFARTDRVYKESPSNFPGQFFISVFRIGVLAMTMCLCFCTVNHAPFSGFWAICGILLVIHLVKMTVNVLLDYTFSLSRRFGNGTEAYRDLITITAAVLYPILLILLHVKSSMVVFCAVGLVALLFLGAWMYRCARTYLVSPSAILYLIAYTATMEVLPMILLFYLSEKTIAIL